MKSRKKSIFLIEDHDEALKLWRKAGVRNLDLVHVDAHMDFGFHRARPVEQIFKDVKSVKELKQQLEESIAFKWYEDDFEKQTNIGNYIYPAMQENIVRDFYWVIPGGLEDFKKSRKIIKNILRGLGRFAKYRIYDGIASASLFERRFIVCVLEKLPVLKQKAMLDIDTDFLLIENITKANNITDIGKRKPWIMPQHLAGALKRKIKRPAFITIAYSVNGGYTPMKYKYLGDDIACHLAPDKVDAGLKRRLEAGMNFNLFDESGKAGYYRKAVQLNPSYRAPDNNYGDLYLATGKITEAKGEFLKILNADPKNPGCLFGLGSIALKRNRYRQARKLYHIILHANNNNRRIFNETKKLAVFGLAKAEFGLGNYQKSEALFRQCRRKMPLDAQSYYFLGRIAEKRGDCHPAVKFYQDAMILGFDNLELSKRIYRMRSDIGNNGIFDYLMDKCSRLKMSVSRSKKAGEVKREIAKLEGGIREWMKKQS